MKKIGVLGGMGPEATIIFQQRLLKAVRAQDDQDHIPLLIDMNPQVPSRLAYVLDQTIGARDPGPVLGDMAQRLDKWGAEALAMPCNTAHLFAEAIQRKTALPFFNMVKLSVQTALAKSRAGGVKAAGPRSDRDGLNDPDQACANHAQWARTGPQPRFHGSGPFGHHVRRGRHHGTEAWGPLRPCEHECRTVSQTHRQKHGMRMQACAKQIFEQNKVPKGRPRRPSPTLSTWHEHAHARVRSLEF